MTNCLDKLGLFCEAVGKDLRCMTGFPILVLHSFHDNGRGVRIYVEHPPYSLCHVNFGATELGMRLQNDWMNLASEMCDKIAPILSEHFLISLPSAASN